ncbi:MAG: TIM44-like domain-containing protein [Acidobacteriota bacterium]
MKKTPKADLVSDSLCLLMPGASVVFLLLLFCEEVTARVGGGQSYGGHSGGGSGGSGAGGALIWLIFQLVRLLLYLTIEYPIIGIPIDILLIAGVIYYFSRRAKRSAGAVSNFSTAASTAAVSSEAQMSTQPDGFAGDVAQLRKFDPNFSEIVFTDFCYALYAKAQEARGHDSQTLDLFSPYISDGARNGLRQRNPPGLKEVKGIIVGAMPINGVRGLDTPLVSISVLFETNYTEVTQANKQPVEMTYYVRERWDLERKRDVLSPTPAQATALHCPRCGAPLRRDTIGACAFCGTKIDSGEFQWYVRDISLLEREAKGPLLTADVPEVGTDYPSVIQPGFENARGNFESNNPSFSWAAFQKRARLIFDELQAAWSTLNWERARPHETDNIFQMHQYWIEAYRRQGLRNMLDQCVVTAMQPVKFGEDAFYNSITLRIGAQGYDYTIDASGEAVSGSRDRLRYWSEYWTFIRNRHAKPLAARADLNCPNCGAPLQVNLSGICAFCGGKITSGEFDWVLSRIEQDESYTD